MPNTGAVAPIQIVDGIEKIGGTTGFTTIVTDVIFAHVPAVGVKP